MFWEKFIFLCNQNNKKPNNVTKELGLSTATATAWKKGAIPRDTIINKLAKYFNVSKDFFINEKIIPSKKASISVPVLGTIAAGIPIDAITEILDYEEIPEAMANDGSEYFALKIKGHSMEPRIWNGDVVIVRKQEDCDNGQIAIVCINGDEATCKRIKKEKSGVFLISLNSAYEPMFYSNQEIEELPVRILGRVVEVRGKNF